ncbi:hypothetical protein CPLU01_13238 [Colletotrichum plurivorum]|uniref:2EXR domain-containing protein n=1 Tax=Colletotrichum plurivorum TaxID=2175906 RepID=A0A8H6JT13_9PEZI|nr:hypothetical protein CPLU01_13238 [Colletotrichum plurivorum]
MLVEVKKLAKADTTPTFHFFPNLPPELRQRIWELSPLEPRTVVISDIPTRLVGNAEYEQQRPPRARAPAVLHANRESRLCTQSYYTKYFAAGAADGRYDWINLEVDTIHITQYSLRTVAKELPLVRNLVVEGFEVSMLSNNHVRCLWNMWALETVTMLHRAHFYEPYDDEIDPPWWAVWFFLIMEYEEAAEPVRFRLKAVHPESDHVPLEINQENYREVESYHRVHGVSGPIHFQTRSGSDPEFSSVYVTLNSDVGLADSKHKNDDGDPDVSDMEDVTEGDGQQADSELEGSSSGTPGNYDVKPTDSEGSGGVEDYSKADAATRWKSHIRKWLRDGLTVAGWVLAAGCP